MDDRKQLAKLLRKHPTALLITRDLEGQFHSRPMEIEGRERGGELWFATTLDTQKVGHLQANPTCGVALHGGGRSPAYVSISGQAELVRDRRKIRELWSPSWRAWFPDGPEQADLVLLRIKPERVEFVRPSGGRLKVLWTIARRVLTGKRVEPDRKHVLEQPA